MVFAISDVPMALFCRREILLIFDDVATLMMHLSTTPHGIHPCTKPWLYTSLYHTTIVYIHVPHHDCIHPCTTPCLHYVYTSAPYCAKMAPPFSWTSLTGSTTDHFRSDYHTSGIYFNCGQTVTLCYFLEIEKLLQVAPVTLFFR